MARVQNDRKDSEWGDQGQEESKGICEEQDAQAARRHDELTSEVEMRRRLAAAGVVTDRAHICCPDALQAGAAASGTVPPTGACVPT